MKRKKTIDGSSTFFKRKKQLFCIESIKTRLVFGLVGCLTACLALGQCGGLTSWVDGGDGGISTSSGSIILLWWSCTLLLLLLLELISNSMSILICLIRIHIRRFWCWCCVITAIHFFYPAFSNIYPQSYITDAVAS